MNTEAVQILWDASHLWGLMALAAMRCLGVPCRLISAKDIAHGRLFRKPPKLLIVPGGNARQKSGRLGARGLAAIRAWVAAGGAYLGFCGGAGLALGQMQPDQGLGLCPWGRQSYAQRLHHLVSGHVLANSIHGRIPLPVWWPGRFASGAERMEVLASYSAPAEDIWLGDRPLARGLQTADSSGQQMGACASLADFPAGQPLIIRGAYGHGSYILSYAHLETPESAAANHWLYEILSDYGAGPVRDNVISWATLDLHCADRACYQAAHQRLRRMLESGCCRQFFFPRTAWLLGWRQGLPGMICNCLLADLSELADFAPARIDTQTGLLLAEFFRLAEGYFQKLEAFGEITQTLAAFAGERDRIFGHPMLGGGIAGTLLERLEGLILQNQRRHASWPGTGSGRKKTA